MIDLHKFREDCLSVRERSPLVHNITNYVAMNFSANGLLAIGASPIMSACEEEMAEITGKSAALVINIGCLDKFQISSMERAALAALEKGIPWVLDPVGAGASTLRNETCIRLIENYHPDIIRGNASEIMVLAGRSANSRGVDSVEESSSALEAAILLAKESGALVSVSGETDYITDGLRTETIRNGNSIMPRVTAMGCLASSLTGAFAAVDANYFNAALHTMALMGVCGEMAGLETMGTGSFAVHFMDCLSEYDVEQVSAKIRQ